MKFILLIITITIILSDPKKILELNNESFNKIVEDNRYNYKKMLLIIFYANNCSNCYEALNIINNDLIDEYKYNDKIEFGKVNCDLEENIWINIRFNITRIPYIILIKGNFYYELNSNYDKYELNKFINGEKNLNDLIKLPNDINTFQKILIIINQIYNNSNQFSQKYFNINININFILFLLILLIILFFWLFLYLFKLCCCYICFCKICRKKKQKRKNNKIIKKEDLSNISSDLSQGEIDYLLNPDINSSELNDSSFFNEQMSDEEFNKKYNKKKKNE